MNWIESLQKAIQYIEEHLLENVTMEQISAQAHISPFHFQRTFALLTDVTVFEYIRRRRLTLAAHELLQSDHKIIDLAHKYGFDTPESFSKAFRRQHGIAPSEARKSSTSIKSYNRLVIQVSLKGAEPMNYKIVEQDEFTLVGIKQAFSYVDGENLREIPKIWQEAYSSGTEDRLVELNNGAIQGLLGVCVDQTEIEDKQMEYWIGTAYEGEVPEGLASITIPASKWSVFEVQGPMPESIQSLWKQIVSEWFPSNPYEHAGIPELEVYPGHHQPPQIWIPIK
ncbi:AraC family transcriptional regulator [Paenibacillus xylanilyticus]|uniref:AraC family transcriptional regulator n=1 Tax=Paenibacillus xylanilyticus TaxID=248903 RepID=A0A7Y6C416_9BACL|nr:AraC family transcriptional regulator [Paenibacillus xylanilyticus]NUU80151.1 AraC family transcriptional regulator [Paenibacillus xylanilyticus]